MFNCESFHETKSIDWSEMDLFIKRKCYCFTCMNYILKRGFVYFMHFILSPVDKYVS